MRRYDWRDRRILAGMPNQCTECNNFCMHSHMSSIIFVASRGLNFQIKSPLESVRRGWRTVDRTLARWLRTCHVDSNRPLTTAARSPGIFQQVRGVQRPLAAPVSSCCSTLCRISVAAAQPWSHSKPWISIGQCVAADFWRSTGIRKSSVNHHSVPSSIATKFLFAKI